MVNNHLLQRTVFEMNCEVDPNGIEEPFSYSSPTEKSWGRGPCVKQVVSTSQRLWPLLPCRARCRTRREPASIRMEQYRGRAYRRLRLPNWGPRRRAHSTFCQ